MRFAFFSTGDQCDAKIPLTVFAIFLALFAVKKSWADADVAPTTPHNSEIRISLGPTYEQITEKLLFGERYSGVGTNGSITLLLHRDENRHEISWWGDYATLNDPENLSAISVKTGFAYRYAHRRFVSMDGKWIWHLGPQLAAKYSVQIFEALDDSHGYWLTRYDFSLNNWLSYASSEHVSFFGMVSVPFLGVMSRPEYRRDYNSDRPDPEYIVKLIHRNREISSFNDYFEMQLESGARFEFNERWSEIVSYHFDYTATNVPKRRKTLDQSLTLAINYRF